MRYTLLESTQLLLSAMESDEINSITDTVESTAVANLLKNVYYDIATEIGVDEHEGLFELTASGDNTKPTLMTVPDDVVRLDRILYNYKLSTETFSNYQEVGFKPFDEFLEYTRSFKDQTSSVGEMTFTQNSETFEMMFDNTVMPRFYTSMDDFTILFDSYLATEDTTLQKSKTMCYGSVYPVFTLSDSFAPDLDPTQFSYYLNRAKVRAFAELKQAPNLEAATETRNQKIRIQKVKRRVQDRPERMKLPNYGRK